MAGYTKYICWLAGYTGHTAYMCGVACWLDILYILNTFIGWLVGSLFTLDALEKFIGCLEALNTFIGLLHRLDALGTCIDWLVGWIHWIHYIQLVVGWFVG